MTEVLAIRGHNEGSLFRRRTGQWVALVTMRDGRRVSRWAKDRDAAKAELAELLRLRDAGAPMTGRVRLGAYLERWVASDHGLAPATRRKHESAIRVHLVPQLGHFRLSELHPNDVSLALHDLHRSGLAPQSVRHLRATLRRCLADAYRDGLVTRNAAGLSKPPPLARHERQILDATQARILIESTRDTRYGPLWTILVTTGLRISEALGLAWSDVDMGGNDERSGQDLDLGPGARLGSARARGRHSARAGDGAGQRSFGPSLTVRHQLARENGEWVRRQPKTAKGRRTIPLTPLGVEALRAQRAMQREWMDDFYTPSKADLSGSAYSAHIAPIDGLVFTSPTGHPLHGTNVVKRLADDLAAAGLPHVTAHDLRHSAATILFSQGLPIEAIADLLGHSTVRVTQDLYRHSVQSFSVMAAERMQEALG